MAYTKKFSKDSAGPSDLCQKITDKLIVEMEAGATPWRRQWSGTGRDRIPLRHNGHPYQGMNIMLLWIDADLHGYTSPVWMTYRQAMALGGQVRKGEHGSGIVFASRVNRKVMDNKTGEEVEKSFSFLRGYTVFNLNQIDGFSPKVLAKWNETAPNSAMTAEARISLLEDFIAKTGAKIEHGMSTPKYSLISDKIGMPDFKSYENPEAYYADLLHELAHWTSDASRLNRTITADYRKAEYAYEELVAELSSAFLSAEFSLTAEPREGCADYLQKWLKGLKNDKKMIFKAAADAQKVVNYLLEVTGYARQAAPEEDMDHAEEERLAA